MYGALKVVLEHHAVQVTSNFVIFVCHIAPFLKELCESVIRLASLEFHFKLPISELKFQQWVVHKY
jgi:hypothetical protein